jgi:hypothetical protein
MKIRRRGAPDVAIHPAHQRDQIFRAAKMPDRTADGDRPRSGYAGSTGSNFIGWS